MASSDEFIFNLNLADPCSVATLSISPSIIPQTIVYNVEYPSFFQSQYVLDPEFATVSTEAVCPPLELSMVDLNGDSLDSAMFDFDQTTNTFSIVASDIVNDTGDHTLKLIASFPT